MKKILLSAVAVLAMVACEKKTTVESSDTDVVKETEVVTPATPDTVVKEVHDENPDGTSVNVSSDGVNVSSKSGEKNTEVNIDATKK